MKRAQLVWSRVSGGATRRRARISKVAVYASPFRGAVCTSGILRKPLGRAVQQHWEMRRIRPCRIPVILP